MEKKNINQKSISDLSPQSVKCTKDKYVGMKAFIRKVESVLTILFLTLTYYLIWGIFYRGENIPLYYGKGKYILMGVYALLILVIFYLCEAFKFGHKKLTDVILSQWISLVIVNFITYFQLCLIANRMISVLPILLLSGIEIIIAFTTTYLYTALYHIMYVPKNMIMIYGNEKAISLKLKMETRQDKYRVTKLISYKEGYKKIREEISKHDAVIINNVPAEVRNDILKYCYRNSIRTYVVPKISDIITRGGEEINLFDTALLLVRGRGLTPAQKLVKRIFDVVLCLIAMIPFAPIMLIVSICIKIEDRGPIFYKQARVTENGRVFDILKFRSMIDNAEKDGKSIPATDHDPRITKVGGAIRAMRIDELPQLLNILKGDMSIVGPRPERVEHVEKYSEEIPEFELRTKVKGGLTGYAQVFGKYNTSAYDKLKLDLMYIENYSILMDIKLIFLTVSILFKKESTEGFDKVISMQTMMEVAATRDGEKDV